MFKKQISHQATWLLMVVSIYTTGSSCPSTPPSNPTPPASLPTPTLIKDDADAASSTSSGYDSDGSGISRSSSCSSFSSGSTYSAPSTPKASSAPFAGLPSTGNTCYMNAVLQIIAALYQDEINNYAELKDLVKKINNSHQPLDPNEIMKFIESLPTEAKRLANSNESQDPAEFIDYLMKKIKVLSFIECTEYIYFKKRDRKIIYRFDQKPDFHTTSCHGCILPIPILPKEPTLTGMIEVYQNQVMGDGHSLDQTKLDKAQAYKKNKIPCCTKPHLDGLSIKDRSKKGHTYITYKVFNNLPSKLCICLLRSGDEDNNSKIEAKVPGSINIAINENPDNSGTKTSFALQGFILHTGNNSSNGHYIAYVKRQDKWYKADNGSVIEVSEQRAEDQSQNAYLLFYKKK